MRLNGQERKSIRVVFDTNVLVSALIFGGHLRLIFDLIKNQKVIPCFIETTLSEFQTVLQYQKFKVKLEKLSLAKEEIINAVAEKSIILPDPLIVPKIVADLPDNYLLACAISCQASFIVSGDKHLLKIKEFQGIPIVSPAQLLRRIQK